ncbi:MAG: universal stress protein [Aureispira sp.]|nr:universal stress protein [Aureispira sp.]
MKHILVPTDFSKNAERALDYAINIANRFGSTIYLIHAYHTTSHAGHLANIDRIVHDDRSKSMEDLIFSKKDELKEGSSLQGKVTKGYITNSIEGAADKVVADLVVMGTLGSNQPNVFMGSTARSLVKAMSKPTVAVPIGAALTVPTRVVVAIDAYSMSHPTVFAPLIKMVKRFDAKLHLVHVESDAMNTDIDPKIKEYLKEAKLAYTYTKIETEDVTNGILSFTEQKEADMLCVVSRQRSWFSSLFHSSVTQKMTMATDIPILVLHD